jgi:hypothetical protein
METGKANGFIQTHGNFWRRIDLIRKLDRCIEGQLRGDTTSGTNDEGKGDGQAAACE